MAIFNFNISEDVGGFNVELLDVVTTDCSTIFTYKINAPIGNTIRMNCGQTDGFNDNTKVIQSGVDTPWDGGEISVTYGPDLYVSFSISNSGLPGFFRSVIFNAYDDTTTHSNNSFTTTVTRSNDSNPCDSPINITGTFDILEDTPDDKIGHALKLVRVDAAEENLEYVDPASLPGLGDLSYTHTQAVASLTWTINHGLGKMPSVVAIDGSGNELYGDITYTDLNNLTITFNTSFSGVAYLN